MCDVGGLEHQNMVSTHALFISPKEVKKKKKRRSNETHDKIGGPPGLSLPLSY